MTATALDRPGPGTPGETDEAIAGRPALCRRGERLRCLVVHAHPVPESYATAVFGTVCRALERAGHEVRPLDLYAEGFDPVLRREEREGYHTPGRSLGELDPHVAHLRWAQAVVFVYPTWWYGLPAMLKGWLDRVWLPEIAFTMPEPYRPVGPLLTHIRLLGAVSTYGAPWWFTRFWVGDPGRRTILRGLRPLCAPRCRTFWLAHYRMDSSTPVTRSTFLARVDARLARL